MSSQEALQAFYDALLDGDAERLYEQAPCGYLSTTPDGTIIKVNETFLTLTGYQRHELLGRRSFAELLTAGGRIYHETHYAPILRMHGRAREIALDLVTADGTRLPVLVNAVLERGPGGEPTVIRTAVFDATERRGYERELLRAKQSAEESEARARALARTLQQTLIPPSPPRIPGLDVAAVYRPAGDGEEVGGDFYDIFQIGDGDWVVVIGDVCGKGVEAAVVTALARYTVRAATVRRRRPSTALADLNDVLLRHETDRFCTAALMRLRQRDGSWTVAVSAGGHPLPVLLAGDRDPVPFGRSGSLLGVMPEPSLHDSELVLRPADALVLYTDGVTEGRRNGEFYGEERLTATLSRHRGGAAALTEGTLAEVMEFQGGLPRDDIAVVAVTVPG